MKSRMMAAVAVVLVVSGQAFAQLPNGATTASAARGRATTAITQIGVSVTAKTAAVAAATDPATWWVNYLGPNPGCLTQEEVEAKVHVDLASTYYNLAVSHLAAAVGYVAAANGHMALGDAYFAVPNYTLATTAYNAAEAAASSDAFAALVSCQYYLSLAATELSNAKTILGVQ